MTMFITLTMSELDELLIEAAEDGITAADYRTDHTAAGIASTIFREKKFFDRAFIGELPADRPHPG